MKYDIPINFTIEHGSEALAEEFLHKHLNKMIEKNGMEELIEFQNFEFITKESCSSGCGNNHCC